MNISRKNLLKKLATGRCLRPLSVFQSGAAVSRTAIRLGRGDEKVSFAALSQTPKNFTSIASSRSVEEEDEVEVAKKTKTSWEHKFKLLLQFKALHGHCDVPIDYEVDGIKLGGWASFQRKEYKKIQDNLGAYVSSVINPRRVARLEAAGFDFNADASDNTENTAMDYGSLIKAWKAQRMEFMKRSNDASGRVERLDPIELKGTSTDSESLTKNWNLLFSELEDYKKRNETKDTSMAFRSTHPELREYTVWK